MNVNQEIVQTTQLAKNNASEVIVNCFKAGSWREELGAFSKKDENYWL